jgi:hypothetical protein
MLYPAELRVRRGRVHSTGFSDLWGKIVRGRGRAVAVDVGRSEKISGVVAHHDSEARRGGEFRRVAWAELRLSNWNHYSLLWRRSDVGDLAQKLLKRASKRLEECIPRDVP